MGFSRQEYWSGLPFSSPVDHFLSELSTMIRLSWVALHGMVYSFIELDKTVVHVISLVSFLWFDFHSVCPLMDKDKRLMEAPDGRDWWGNWILFWGVGPCSVNLESNFLLMDGAVFAPCCLTLDQIMVEVMKIIGTSFKRYQVGLSQCPQPCSTGLEKVSFHFNPKERQCQRMLKLPHSCSRLTC